MRMVNADKLEKAVIDAGIFKDEWEFKTAWGVPVVDAEPVVRCKDCVNFRYRTRGFCYLNPGMSWNADGNAFCSYGRRKDEIQD